MTELAPKEIGREDVRMLVRRGAQLVDVLPKEEYEAVHISGAINIPLLYLRRNTANRLQWDKVVIVYSKDCLDDSSARAAWRLASMGFTQVFRYPGGRSDWLANGLPAEGNAARMQTAGDLADLDIPTCKRLDRIAQVKERVHAEGKSDCVVVNDQFVVLGLLRGNDLDHANPQSTAEDAMQHDPATFRLNASLEEVAAYFVSQALVKSVLITTTDGKLFGLLNREAIPRA
jgi:rhodanese-related sulfurtransferase